LIEEDLIEMARSKFQEYMLATYSQEELRNLRPDLENQIRVSATSRIMSFDEETDIKMSLVSELDDFDFTELFPSVH